MNQMNDIGPDPALEALTEPLDVLIVGAGISGIAAARYLQQERPDDSYAVIEEQDGFGGTWRTHKYPGIRSDSDLHTFGYGFKPWVGPPIATADEINAYLGETIAENDLGRHIHYGWRIETARWNSATNLWTVTARQSGSGKLREVSARFLWMCQGYYRHSKGYTPDWPGMADFNGEIIHPQSWPEDFDGAGKRMVVIGSGATAATLVPNVTDMVDHVTMLQRSPTYFRSERNEIAIAARLRELQVDEVWIHEIVRREMLVLGRDFALLCAANPEAVKKELIATAKKYLGEDFDYDKHLTPSYAPWRQRLARIPDGDLFKALAGGKASIETDEIEKFVPEGILLKSGKLLEADVIVTATGFDLCALGDIAFEIDGQALDLHDTVGYRSMMFTGVPNLVWVMGYFRSSWTLRAELVAQFVMRLLDHMQAGQKSRVEVKLRASEQDMELFDWADEEDFNPGYLLRGQNIFPRRGASNEWKLNQDYWVEKDEFAAIDLDDELFAYR
ncbi:NAD(P)/FAD-dependent oxidoreductase [Pseudooceanicola sp.]|uniref:flavin-containing monooxygenase n=1 Tax=Pseudooceanicola sp. TaxID=1914328 RepID=UPI002629936D|nr:NAD(P)/FAD-dependent oxidoreductase [Pseudooceanicola sp.]MDF1855664.1 NAD(P)/FAD-dependent oxidoreductase [Pseudooceanicola sp.]